MIRVHQLNKYYSKRKRNECHALKDVNLQIDDGEIVAIMGKSGAGKSSLLHILAGIDKFDSGDVCVGNTNLGNASDAKLSLYRNREVGIVLQDYGLIEDYTAFDNILIPLEFAGIPRKQAKIRAVEVLSALDIAALRKNRAMELSGGQRQRVAIARAIVNKPKYLFADEPTGALDEQTSEDIMAIFNQLNAQGITVIIVTHDPAVAEHCKRVIKISDGKIV